MLQITALPAFSDNYIWLLHHDGVALAIDPGDARPVQTFCRQHQLNLAAILITHHHNDHIGGVAELVATYGCPVYGPDNPAIDTITHPLTDGMQLTVSGLVFQILAVPGHTADHIAYYMPGRLFCGDTLFACGCGRVFDSTPVELYRSLQQLAGLPPQTQIYCTHEYTLANQRFALTVEPDNSALQQRHRRDRMSRERQQATLPTCLQEELATNPFLRCHQPGVRAAVERHCGRPLPDPQTVFVELRRWKDDFR